VRWPGSPWVLTVPPPTASTRSLRPTRPDPCAGSAPTPSSSIDSRRRPSVTSAVRREDGVGRRRRGLDRRAEPSPRTNKTAPRSAYGVRAVEDPGNGGERHDSRAASGPPPRRSVTRPAIGRMAPRLQRARAALELVVKRQCKERPEERSGEKRRRQGSRAESGRPEQPHVDQAPCDASAVPRQQPDEQHPGGERDERRARAQRRRSRQLRLAGSRRTAIARPLRR
jgi:hypothetical protein